MDQVIVNEIGMNFTRSFPLIIIAVIITFIITFLITASRYYGLIRLSYDIFNVPYKYVEFIHDGIVRKKFIVPLSKIKNGMYKLSDKTEINLSDSFNPIRITSKVSRYTFKNDNILPMVNAEVDSNGDPFLSLPTKKFTPIRLFEVYSRSKDGSLFIMDRKFWKNLLENHFVEKIKKEKQKGMEAIFEFLQTTPGMVLMALAAIVVLMMVWNSLHR